MRAAGLSKVVLAIMVALLVLASCAVGSGARPLAEVASWEEEPQQEHGRKLLGFILGESVQDGSYGGYGDATPAGGAGRRVALEDAEADGVSWRAPTTGGYGGY